MSDPTGCNGHYCTDGSCERCRAERPVSTEDMLRGMMRAPEASPAPSADPSASPQAETRVGIHYNWSTHELEPVLNLELWWAKSRPKSDDSPISDPSASQGVKTPHT